MERSRVTLITLMCLLFSTISGHLVERRVRPGDSITIYSDCVFTAGFEAVWKRKYSFKDQPPLTLRRESLNNPHYSFVWNNPNKTYDLLVKNVTESDLGLYSCVLNNKPSSGQKSEDRDGNLTTFVSFLDTCAYLHKTRPTDHKLNTSIPNSTSSCPSSVSDCSESWKLLVSGGPVCVLLFSILSFSCVYCICNRRTKGSKEGREPLTDNTFQVGCVEDHQCEKTMNGQSCDHTAVCYTSLRSDLKSD